MLNFQTWKLILSPRVPAADAKFSQEAMNETFLLTNIAPQVGAGFNRHCTLFLFFFLAEVTC